MHIAFTDGLGNQMAGEFKITFWGVRGSYPAAGRHTVGYGGNTTSVEVRVNGHVIILDSGSGIINLGKKLAGEFAQTGKPRKLHLFFTHVHHDHTQGFPFFAPAYNPASILEIYAPGFLERSLKEVLEDVMAPPAFPLTTRDLSSEFYIESLIPSEVVAIKDDGETLVRKVSDAPFKDEDKLVRIRLMRSYAHPSDVLFYRIEYNGKAFVFATDTEGYVNIDRRLITFAKGCDLIVHDAQYTEDHYIGQRPGTFPTQGFGHSTPKMAAVVAESAEVGMLALTHYDPSYDDETVDELVNSAREVFPSSIGAYEGLEIDLFDMDKAENISPHAKVKQSAD